MSQARINDNIQDLSIALKLITRVRCHSRAGGFVGQKYTFATREERKMLEEAAEMIVEVKKNLSDRYKTYKKQDAYGNRRNE